MRLQNKYTKFSKLSVLYKESPSRILKFHRTKWKKIQQLLFKNKTTNVLNSYKKVLLIKKWSAYKARYSEGVKLKKYFDCVFDQAFSILFFKKLKFLNKAKNKVVEYNTYLMRPEFRVDIFFWRLKFFSSCYEARRFINENKIRVNDKKIHPNYFLKKGDIISFDSTIYHKNFLLKTLLLNQINTNKFFSFIEIDYYTTTVVMLKNYRELNENDMSLFVNKFCNVTKIKTFID
jgi:ribosomal protein S4